MSLIPEIVLRPSTNALGSAEKLSSMRTISATPLAAPDPDCSAIPTCADLMDFTSLTPSPIIATYLLLRLRTSMTFSLFSGFILPKMLVLRTTSSNSESGIFSSSGPEMMFLSPGISAILNRASTVTGSSPEMTLMSILF